MTNIERAENSLRAYGWVSDPEDPYGNAYKNPSYGKQVIRVEDASTLRWEHEAAREGGHGCDSLHQYLRDLNMRNRVGDPFTGRCD